MSLYSHRVYYYNKMGYIRNEITNWDAIEQVEQTIIRELARQQRGSEFYNICILRLNKTYSLLLKRKLNEKSLNSLLLIKHY